MEEAQLVVVAGVGRGEVVCIWKTDTKGHGLKDLKGRLVTFPVEVVHEGPEAGEGRFREPLVGLIVIFFASNVEALLSLIVEQPVIMTVPGSP